MGKSSLHIIYQNLMRRYIKNILIPLPPCLGTFKTRTWILPFQRPSHCRHFHDIQLNFSLCESYIVARIKNCNLMKMITFAVMMAMITMNMIHGNIAMLLINIRVNEKQDEKQSQQ